MPSEHRSRSRRRWMLVAWFSVLAIFCAANIVIEQPAAAQSKFSRFVSKVKRKLGRNKSKTAGTTTIPPGPVARPAGQAMSVRAQVSRGPSAQSLGNRLNPGAGGARVATRAPGVMAPGAVKSHTPQSSQANGTQTQHQRPVQPKPDAAPQGRILKRDFFVIPSNLQRPGAAPATGGPYGVVPGPRYASATSALAGFSVGKGGPYGVLPGPRYASATSALAGFSGRKGGPYESATSVLNGPPARPPRPTTGYFAVKKPANNYGIVPARKGGNYASASSPFVF